VPFLKAQKTVFTINEEKARYELHTQNIKIVRSFYKIKDGEISDSLKTFIVELMERKKGFVSVEFIDDKRAVVEHQDYLTEELVVKNLNRYDAVFVRQNPKEYIEKK
jgi:hypothetical protein